MRIYIYLCAVILFSRLWLSSVVLEGFDLGVPVRAINKGKYICYLNTEVNSCWEYAMTGSEDVCWQSVPVVQPVNGTIFAVPCGMGASKSTNAKHSLYINGIKILDFSAQYALISRWTNNDVQIEFHTLLVDKNRDLFGIMFVSVPMRLLNRGQPVNFSVRGEIENSKSWFMLSSVSGSATYRTAEIQSERKIFLEIEKARKASAISPETDNTGAAVTRICRWPEGRRMALSAVVLPISQWVKPVFNSCRIPVTILDIPGMQENISNFFSRLPGDIPPQAQESCRLFFLTPAFNHVSNEEIFTEAYNLGLWLVEICNVPETGRKEIEKHCRYLDSLGFNIWFAEPEKILEYSRRTEKAELIISKNAAGSDLVTVSDPLHRDRENEQPLFVQIEFPVGKKIARCFVDAKPWIFKYIYQGNNYGIRFAVPAYGKSVEILWR